MRGLKLDTMTSAEFAAWRDHSVGEYAKEHVTAGTYGADESLQRAAAEFDDLLPAGLDTPHMLLFTARDDADEAVGVLWLSLVHPRGAPDTAFIYDIEVRPERRGQGYGRALLAAAEDEVRRRGLGALTLNVFGDNATAISLYASSGYRVTTQQMRKAL
jgi:ribosomal protein S18 acetylase RimI-like enzyme